MHIQAESKNDPTRLAIEGELTIYTVAQWKPRLLERISASSALELDLSAVNEIDTAGQQLLMAAQLHARALGRPLRVSACSTAVADLLALCWLASWFGSPCLSEGSAS
jgi:anti-sigma B factor antagonist